MTEKTSPRDDVVTVMVLEGDWGGQVYLTVPVDRLGPDAQLEALLLHLDRIAWPSNEGQGTRVYREDAMLDEGIPVGMGGGCVFSDAVWLHPEFAAEVEMVRHLLDLTAGLHVHTMDEKEASS